jgi:hypothetical protein
VSEKHAVSKGTLARMASPRRIDPRPRRCQSRLVSSARSGKLSSLRVFIHGGFASLVMFVISVLAVDQ